LTHKDAAGELGEEHIACPAQQTHAKHAAIEALLERSAAPRRWPELHRGTEDNHFGYSPSVGPARCGRRRADEDAHG
jgi:hypothetical protein